MLYRLTPPAGVTWTNLPVPWDSLGDYIDQGVDFENPKIEWNPTEDPTYDNDLLRIALRHGYPTSRGIVLHVRLAVDVRRSDQLRTSQRAIDEGQAQIRAQYGDHFEALMPGWTAYGEELDQRVRQSTEEAAREADEDLATVLAAPVRPELLEHWRRLGGRIPRQDANDDE